ncbi:MAG: DNA polymerase IV [Candidatus Cloacimonetes bacterium]|nr:DNA polymerase IV [Candidatus Cloacimonadota bacterium]MBS3767412.1 DNA polymerase IV [Candidatus Cloacimonadota bacterium]
MNKTILHMDMDAFFASIEQRDNLELRGKPVIVGREDSNRGIVTTASYEARKYGVHSAMSIFKARRLCPHGIFVDGNYEKYSKASKKIFEICRNFTPKVYPISIDEAFLDVSGSIPYFKSAKEIAVKLQEKIKDELFLTCSIGIAPNKMLAKIASDMQKPAGITIINKDNLDEFLKELPVEKIPGIGKKTAEKLKNLGIFTAKNIEDKSETLLIKHFGKFGKQLYYMGQGKEIPSATSLDERKKQKAKSISNEITFYQSSSDRNYLQQQLIKIANKVCYRLRLKNATAKKISLKVKFSDLTVKTLDRTLQNDICYEADVYRMVTELFRRIDLKNNKIRLLGIKLAALEFSDEVKQLDLFKEKKEKVTRISQAVDKIRNKYGRKIISIGKNENNKS